MTLHRQLRPRGVRAIAVVLVAALGVAVWSAHVMPGDHHMGEAVAMCLAVVAIGAAVVAAPRMGRLLPAVPRPCSSPPPAAGAVLPSAPAPGRARGHPALLQVFRR